MAPPQSKFLEDQDGDKFHVHSIHASIPVPLTTPENRAEITEEMSLTDRIHVEEEMKRVDDEVTEHLLRGLQADLDSAHIAKDQESCRQLVDRIRFEMNKKVVRGLRAECRIARAANDPERYEQLTVRISELSDGLRRDELAAKSMDRDLDTEDGPHTEESSDTSNEGALNPQTWREVIEHVRMHPVFRKLSPLHPIPTVAEIMDNFEIPEHADFDAQLTSSEKLRAAEYLNICGTLFDSEVKKHRRLAAEVELHSWMS